MRRSAALHSSAHSDWCTPLPIVTAARIAMDGIDLDPASDADANRLVGAKKFYALSEDGLTQPWFGRVFVNPPGGQVRPFWCRLIEHWMQRETMGGMEQAIWIGYSLEQLQQLQGIAPCSPLDFPLCVPKKRIKFYRTDGGKADAPTHANYICYLGPWISRFINAFSHLGDIA